VTGGALALSQVPRDAQALCELTLAHGSRSFALASRLLPQEMRRRAAVLYAFCRTVDDDVDLAPAGEHEARLAALVARVRSVYRGEGQAEPIWDAFAELVRDIELPREYPEELLLGMAMDVHGARYATLDELLLYCHRVAGVVGLMMCHVFGVERDSALRNAAHLGIAMQLTNVCRDVAEDWRLGRLYVPGSLLEGHELGSPNALPLELCPAPSREALSRAVRELLHVADDFYASAEQGFGALPARSALGVRAARHVYREIGSELCRRDCDVLAGRSVVPMRRKAVLVAQSLLESLWELPRRTRRSTYRAPSVLARFPEDILPLATPLPLSGASPCLLSPPL